MNELHFAKTLFENVYGERRGHVNVYAETGAEMREPTLYARIEKMKDGYHPHVMGTERGIYTRSLKSAKAWVVAQYHALPVEP